MIDETLYSMATLDLLDRFLAEYRQSAHPEQVLESYSASHPKLADEFRLQAGFSLIDPGDEPADLPDITLLREIGRGGMAVVHEGWQESLGRPVAVKLHRMTDDGPNGVGSFTSAARWPDCIRHRSSRFTRPVARVPGCTMSCP